MCRVTSLGTWNTGDRFFSDVTLARGRGTFNLLDSPADRWHCPDDFTFHAADRAERSSVPVQITLKNKESWKDNANQKA
jgi:hypothetical protein